MQPINDMSPTEKYPNARNAIAVVERAIKYSPSLPQFLRNSAAAGQTVNELMELMRSGAAANVDLAVDAEERIVRAALAGNEFTSEDFRKYLMAVIFGAM